VDKAVDYFHAVQEGKKRVKEAMDLLQSEAGPCYPMLFLKLGIDPWTPVGEEMMRKVLPGKGGKSALVICDGEGNAKTMSTWLAPERAEECSRALEKRGIPEFPGEVKLPV
jgi:hypothetical protein